MAQSEFYQLHAGPVVLAAGINEGETLSLCFLTDFFNVGNIEATHIYIGTFFHARHIILQVVQKDIAVDIGNDEVERTFACQAGSVAEKDIDVVNMVQRDVVLRIFHAPFVDIDGHAMFRAAHTGQYGEDAGAATHVEHFPTLHIIVEDALNHLRRSGMMACAKGHLRIDGDVVFRLRHIFVECSGDDTAVSHHERK